MRFMLILKSTKDSEAGKMPSEESIAAMVKYNQEQAKAGILIDAAGLWPSRRANPILNRRKENGDRWTIHRIEGAGRRLLDYRSEVAPRSDRVGEASSGDAGPGDRNRSARVYCVRLTLRRVWGRRDTTNKGSNIGDGRFHQDEPNLRVAMTRGPTLLDMCAKITLFNPRENEKSNLRNQYYVRRLLRPHQRDCG